MSSRAILADPYELLRVPTSATGDEIWQAYVRTTGVRSADRAALAQAQEDLRQPHKRLAVDMLLVIPTPDDTAIDALIDAHIELPSLVSDDVVALLAIAPEPELELASHDLTFRADLNDEPIVALELDP